jgi:actin-related protein
MYCGGEDIGALVADIGNGFTRIGFAGDDYPRAYFPSVTLSFFCLLFSHPF